MKAILTTLVFLAQLGFAAEAQIHGAGSSFVAPLMAAWASDYAKANPGSQINYQSTGSGAGIRQFVQKTVDFAATDAFMTDEQLKEAPGALHLPVAMGAVVVTYHLPEITQKLVLDGTTTAEIFSGAITKWNDAKIAKLNPEAKLPATAILIAHRSDGSGTTAVFTEYLSKVSPQWKTKIGTGTNIKWPVGFGGKGNEGVSGLVKQTPGAIGYVELIYAAKNGLKYAHIQNGAKAIEPNLKSVTLAAEGALKTFPADFRGSITGVTSAGAYPISGMTWVVFNPQTLESQKAKTLKAFLGWALKDGQAKAPELHYAPLPQSLVKKATAALAQ